MAPRTGPRVKVISPNSEAVTVPRSLSVASSAYSSGHVTPGPASLLRPGFRRGEPRRGGDEMAYGGRPEAAGAALPSRRTALRAMGVNTLHETGPSHGKSAPNNSGAERRQWPLKMSTSRSHSTSHHANASAVKQRQQPTSRRRADDEEAVRRATAALEHAGGAVLRRPFSGGHATSDKGRAATSALGGNTSSLPVQQPERRGLCLPPTIPITSHTRRHRSDYSDYSGNDSSMDSTVSSYKRARSWAEPPPLPVQAASQQPTPTSRPSFYVAQPAAESAAQRLTVPRVCPGMFAGLSAIPVGEELFVGADALHPNCTSTVCAAPVMDAVAASAAGGGLAQQRYCVRPLWSLVGTFKTSLSGLVTIDLKQECLRWSQRNPKGGKQTIKVPLASVLDVFTTRVVQEDEHIEERQYTVVARTSTRPSQVVFGFATATEANHLRNVLKRR
ncbi:hypothetical protein CGC21_24465 [Leishmania donovani]|uniref:PH-like domain-containing protein n=1 Tax=Leishmania donovani TaxID=5661 RepID=A0A504Y2K9_LEIDO|nr:hypothetical protein CGC21_24465 [Leishmania donovani]